MSLPLGPEAGVPTLVAPLDVQQYLAERAARPEFVMVEIGHGGQPVAYQQPAWLDGRQYFGFEGWVRDPDGSARKNLEAIVAAAPNPNVHFIDLNVKPNGNGQSRSLWFSDGYDPTMPLPDATADEVFLSNVFGDDHLAEVKERTQDLAREVSRLPAADGLVVIRETRTPRSALRSLSREVLQRSGLREVARIVAHSPLWQELEHRYAAPGTIWERDDYSNGFYQFLSKVATD